MTVIERLQVLAKEFGSVEKFAEEVGLNPGSLRSAIRRNSELKSDTIGVIINGLPNLNLRWLLLGEGEMWLTEYNRQEGDLSGQQVADNEEEYIRRLNDLLEKRVRQLEEEFKRRDPDRARELGIE